MEVKKIVEGMTAVEVAEVIDNNFKNQNKILEEDIAKQNSVIGVSEYKDFSEAEAVNVGDVRKCNGFLYECVEATTGAFDASKWKKSSFKAETEKKLSELGTQVIYDVTANNDSAKFASLSALLSSENLSTLIPVAVRCGGMSIRFVQSSDNKYVQYRLTADEWSLDTNDWAIADEGVYVENPEFIETILDAEGKITEATRINGIKVLPAGAEFGGNVITSGNNPEYLEIVIDKNNKVLSYRKKDGTLVDNNEIENPTIKRIQAEVSSTASRVFSNPSSIVSFLEYNQIREDKCNNNVRYLLFQESDSPFDNNKFIKNGKIYQNIGNREYKAKIAVFGDTHFGYTLDGSLLLDPTTENRCGMAFIKSNQKNADFSIIVGDVLQGGTLEQVLGSYDLYYDKLKLLNSPCFPMQGNHDELIIHRKLLDLDELTKFGIIEFNGVRIICFKATQIWPTSSTEYDAGDIPDNIFALIKKAIIESYNEGFITILACHYELAYYPDIPYWECPIRKHRDELINLCQQYNVRLFLHGHEHASGLLHKIVKNDEVTLDMTDVLFGWTHVSYSIIEVTDKGFNIVEYDTMTDSVLHTLFIPMVNQENGTIYT